MSYTDFKEISVNNPGTTIRYGGDDLKGLMQILNGKVLSQKRPRILNEWIWLDHFDMAPPAIVPAAPTDTNASRLYIDPNSFKVKVKKTSDTIVDVENIDIPDSALQQITNKAKLHSQIAYKDETTWLTNAMVSASAAIAYSKLVLTASIVDADIAAGGITTRSKLPSPIAFEDKANIFTELQKINKTAQAAVAEVLLEARISDDAVSYLKIENQAATDLVFQPKITTHTTASGAIRYLSYITPGNDTGTAAILAFDVARTGDAAVTTRTLYAVRNVTTNIFAITPTAFDFTNKMLTNAVVGSTITGIIDANIATHTSTKISITAKGQLNSSIFYEDEDNNAGDHFMDFGDIVAPANPAAGIRRLFVDSGNGQLSVRTSAGTSISLETIGTAALDDLSNVVVPTPTLNHVLTFDGTNWVSAAAPGATGGEANTGSSVGTAGIGIFKQKTGVDLQFKKLNAGSTKITITDDTVNDEVDVDVAQANLDLESIGGSITTRSKLPATVVYDDETNSYGDFDQVFRSSRLILRNPGNTFGYIIAGSAITANRTLTIPLLTGNDIAVTEAFAQPLTNKIIDADLNTISNINDNEIAAHTSTKITITAKGQLNPAQVYTDQINTYADGFNQVFKSGRLIIRNPADTFGYGFVSAAITADKLITLPLLASDDVMVTEAFPQILTNKTFDASANTVSNIVDANIGAHTSSKITILTKGQLNAAIAYEDESNIFTLSQKFNSYADFEKITVPADPGLELGRIYFKQIDANNNGLFYKAKRNGVIVEVPV